MECSQRHQKRRRILSIVASKSSAPAGPVRRSRQLFVDVYESTAKRPRSRSMSLFFSSPLCVSLPLTWVLLIATRGHFSGFWMRSVILVKVSGLSSMKKPLHLCLSWNNSERSTFCTEVLRLSTAQLMLSRCASRRGRPSGFWMRE